MNPTCRSQKENSEKLLQLELMDSKQSKKQRISLLKMIKDKLSV